LAASWNESVGTLDCAGSSRLQYRGNLYWSNTNSKSPLTSDHLDPQVFRSFEGKALFVDLAAYDPPGSDIKCKLAEITLINAIKPTEHPRRRPSP